MAVRGEARQAQGPQRARCLATLWALRRLSAQAPPLRFQKAEGDGVFSGPRIGRALFTKGCAPLSSGRLGVGATLELLRLLPCREGVWCTWRDRSPPHVHP